ncbi:MAG: sensor histidine kinase [Desulfobacterales bacterium]|nr:sensor histidine kinase [Desulfobacterales bacterium]
MAAENKRVLPPQKEMVCPISGLPVTTWPQWTGVQISSDYELSISLIGENIVLGRVRGRATRESTRLGLELTREAIAAITSDGRRFIYIEDFAGLTHVSYDARRYYIRFLQSLEGMHTLIICADSPMLHLSVKLARRINSKTNFFETRVVTTFREGILYARAVRMRLDPSVGLLPPVVRREHILCPVSGLAIYAPDAWVVENDFGCRIRFRRLGTDVLCTEVECWEQTGQEDISPLLKRRDEVIQEAFGDQGRFLEIAGYQGLPEQTTRQTRSLMVGAIMKYQERLIGYVVFNAPASVRIAYNVGVRIHNPGFHYAMKPDYDAAVREIMVMQQEKKKAKKSGPRKGGTRESPLKEELLQFLAEINWEEEGFGNALKETDHRHPLKDIYDAISMIKMDIDDIFRDQKRTQQALTESEELSMALLNATTDVSLLADLSGHILAANRQALQGFSSNKALIGLSLSSFFEPELAPYRMAQFRRCIRLGNSVRFEDNLQEHFYDNTIFPVTGADGTVDRVAFYVREITDLKGAESHIHALSQELIKAQESERQRIARDLHDNVAQDLASLIIEVQGLSHDTKGLGAEAQRRVGLITKTLKRSIGSIRELVYDLRPPSLDQLGLVRTLSQYFSDYTEGCKVDVDFQSGGLESLTLDFDAEINIYRLIQEALANVRKHSGASCVVVRLIASHPMLILRIEDNGSGFDVGRRSADALGEKRMGLKGMEERALLLGGTFSIHASPGRGTRLMVRIPMSGNPELSSSDEEENQVLKK